MVQPIILIGRINYMTDSISPKSDSTLTVEVPLIAEQANEESGINHELSPTIDAQADVNQTRLRFHWKDLEFNLFRPGEQNVALGAAVSYKKQFLDLEYPYFILKGYGSVAAFDLFPEENFSDRNVLGLSAALKFFTGSKQKVDIVEFREGLEVSAAFYYGKNLSPLVTVPFSAGASIGIHLPKDSSMWLSGLIENYIAVADVQDAGSVFPFFNKGSVALSADVPKTIDVDLGMDFHYNGARSMHGSISYPFDKPFDIPIKGFLGFNGRFDMTGGSPNNWVMQSGNYFGISAGIDWGTTTSNGDDIGVSARTTFGAKYSPGNASNAPIDALVNPASIPNGSQIKCEGINTQNGTLNNCTLYEKSVDCNYTDFSYVNGNPFAGGAECYTKNGLVVTADRSPSGSGQLFSVSGTETRNKYANLILNASSLNQLISQAKSLTKGSQLILLNDLVQLAYQTYDNQALLIPNGSGRTNSISPDDIYSALHNNFANPDNHTPTTVCRGFAKFVTYVADQLGFEAHAVSIQTKNMSHVITVLREKGSGNGYTVINYGDNNYYSDNRDISRVIQQYAMENGYPPQLQNWVFGADGKPEGVIETGTFKMLQEAAEAPPQLDNFLKGK